MPDSTISYYLGGDIGSGEGPLGGPLHSGWLTAEERWRAEAHGIADCLLTTTAELSTHPLDNALVKRICCDVTQRMRKPHSPQTYSVCFGRALHVLECNHTPRLSSSADDPKAISKRFLSIKLGRGRRFTKDADQVDHSNGVFLQRPERDSRTELLTPTLRRAFIRHICNLPKGLPLSKCA